MKKPTYNHKNRQFFGRKKEVFYPKSKKRPMFSIGDVVGFKNFFKNNSGIINSIDYDKGGEVKYVVKIDSHYIDKQECFEWELFLRPLTRKVLIEKRCKLFNPMIVGAGNMRSGATINQPIIIDSVQALDEAFGTIQLEGSFWEIRYVR